MVTKAQMQDKVDDYLEQYLRAESSVTSLKFRTGSLANMLQKVAKELERYDETNPIIQESIDLIQHPDRGSYGSFTDVYQLVRAAVLDKPDDVEYYTNRLKERYAGDYQRP